MKKKMKIAANKKNETANEIDKDLLKSKNMLKHRINALKKIQNNFSITNNNKKMNT